MADKAYPTDFSTLTAPTTLLGDDGAANGNVVIATDLVANSDAKIPTQKAVKTAIATAVTGLLDFQGSTDCSSNPNYPAASKGDSYVVSVAGKIGGASGSNVAIGDVYFATADNAGGTQAGVGASWSILEHNIPDLATVATTGSASDLSTGTLPNGRFPATLPAADGSNLTALNASNLSAGTVPDARFPATLPTASGANLTAIPAAQLTGSIAAARIPAGLITDTLASLANKPTPMAVAVVNITLSGEQNIDGAGTSSTSIVLLTAQTTTHENGFWITNSGAWTRPTWYPAGGTTQAVQFISTHIRLGTIYSGSMWRMTTTGTVTIGTDAQAWGLVDRKINSTTSSSAPTGTIVGTTDAQTLTNKRLVSRSVTVADATSITPNGDTTDVCYQLNTQATGTLTINAPTGTPNEGDTMIIKLKATNVQTFSWNAIYRGGTDIALPTVSTAAKIDRMGFRYDSVGSKWDIVSLARGY